MPEVVREEGARGKCWRGHAGVTRQANTRKAIAPLNYHRRRVAACDEAVR